MMLVLPKNMLAHPKRLIANKEIFYIKPTTNQWKALVLFLGTL